MMPALLAARGNRVMYEFAQHLMAEVKIIPPMQIAGPRTNVFPLNKN